MTISSDPNDPEVQALAAFLRVLNALEDIRSAINVAERGRMMARGEDARDLAALALAETRDALRILSAGPWRGLRNRESYRRERNCLRHRCYWTSPGVPHRPLSTTCSSRRRTD